MLCMGTYNKKLLYLTLTSSTVQGCNEVYGITNQRSEKGRDQESQPWDLESQRWISSIFHGMTDQGSNFCRFRDQNSHHFWVGSGFKIWVKIWDQLRKK